MSPIRRPRRAEASTGRHVRIYQAMSAAFTPMYQSGSRSLLRLRDLVLAPLSTLPLLRGGLTHLVAGTMIPPLSGTRDP